MIKKINIEPLEQKEKWLENPLLSREELRAALDLAMAQLDKNIDYFGEAFPTPATKENKYPKMDNTEWTNGFWTGLLWLGYEYTSWEKMKTLAMKNVRSFQERVEEKVELDHHDLGFLYSPSTVAAYHLTKDQAALAASIQAADKLMERYQEKGGFIQAWGELGKAEDYRLIIDCLLNLQLLLFAYEQTGNQAYYEVAHNHFYAAVNTVIREDASTFHTYYFDPETGSPLKGVTRQGYSDSSAWARGQAWGIYGIPLTYRYLKDSDCFELFKGVTHYFLNRLPQDRVSYWDLLFTDGSGHERDSSATAIAVCGLHEMLKYLPADDEDRITYQHALHTMLRSLIKDYANRQIEAGRPLLLHGVYSWHSGKGVDEGNIWGDYYYVEALMRLYTDWNSYW